MLFVFIIRLLFLLHPAVHVYLDDVLLYINWGHYYPLEDWRSCILWEILTVWGRNVQINSIYGKIVMRNVKDLLCEMRLLMLLLALGSSL
jgi:hypothetical protein